MSFWKRFRLRKRSDFVLASRDGMRVFESSFILVGRVNDVEDFRVGITATKKIGNAVVRNYCKRKMRVIARSISCDFRSGVDYIFILKKKFIFEEFCMLLRSCEKSVDILNKKANARFSINIH